MLLFLFTQHPHPLALPRLALRAAQVINAPEIRSVLHGIPHLQAYMESLYYCRYGEFFRELGPLSFRRWCVRIVCLRRRTRSLQQHGRSLALTRPPGNCPICHVRLARRAEKVCSKGSNTSIALFVAPFASPPPPLPHPPIQMPSPSGCAAISTSPSTPSTSARRCAPSPTASTSNPTAV